VGAFLWKAGLGTARVKSVCLFLSKKGHRETFAKNELFGQIYGKLWTGPFSEAAPSGEAGVSVAARTATSALGREMSPHPIRGFLPFLRTYNRSTLGKAPSVAPPVGFPRFSPNVSTTPATLTCL
jgi:hypothetical protein